MTPSRRDWLVVGGLSAIAFVITIVATRHGPGVSPDSVSYLTAARTAADGRGFLDFDGSLLSYWPPGFPAILALLDLVGVHGVDAARFLNAALMASAVVLAFLLLRRHVRSPATVLFGTALVAFSPAILRTADMVWAEPLFTVLVLGFVLLLEDACRTGRYPPLAAAGIVASAAILVKYLGFALVPAGVIAVVVAVMGRVPDHTDQADQGNRVQRAAVQGIWFAGWALVGPALWGVRNLNEGEPVFGRRTRSTQSIVTIAGDELEGVGRLFVPDGVPRGLSILIGVAVAALVVAAIVVVVRDRSARAMVPLVLVTAGSFGAAFVSRIGASSDVNARVLSPAYVPVVVLTLWLFDYVRARRGERAAQPALRAISVLALAGLAGYVVWSAGLAWSHGKHGRGYASPGLAASELLDAVGELPSDARVFSNEPLAVAYVTGRFPVRLALGPGEQNAIGRRSYTTRDLGRLACAGPVHVAWFGTAAAPSIAAADARDVRDGVLFEVECSD